MPHLHAQPYFYKGLYLEKNDLMNELYQDILDGEMENREMCDTGVEKALQDASIGAYQYYYFGYPTADFTAYLWVLKNIYAIKTTQGGEVENPENQCYNAIMGEKLREKFGGSFWTDVAQKADSINNMGMSEKEIWTFIACNLKVPPLMAGISSPIVMIKCVTDDLGNLKESSILKSWEEDLDNEALRVVRMLPKWQPIAKTVVIPVVFDWNNKKNCKE